MAEVLNDAYSTAFIGLYSKSLIFHLFHALGKMRSLTGATFKNSKISLLIGKNLEVQPKTNTQKIPTLNLWMNWENLCSNLSFTVENR